jgi:hypothetical protein
MPVFQTLPRPGPKHPSPGLDAPPRRAQAPAPTSTPTRSTRFSTHPTTWSTRRPRATPSPVHRSLDPPLTRQPTTPPAGGCGASHHPYVPSSLCSSGRGEIRQARLKTGPSHGLVLSHPSTPDSTNTFTRPLPHLLTFLVAALDPLQPRTQPAPRDASESGHLNPLQTPGSSRPALP